MFRSFRVWRSQPQPTVEAVQTLGSEYGVEQHSSRNSESLPCQSSHKCLGGQRLVTVVEGLRQIPRQGTAEDGLVETGPPSPVKHSYPCGNIVSILAQKQLIHRDVSRLDCTKYILHT